MITLCDDIQCHRLGGIEWLASVVVDGKKPLCAPCLEQFIPLIWHSDVL